MAAAPTSAGATTAPLPFAPLVVDPTPATWWSTLKTPWASAKRWATKPSTLQVSLALSLLTGTAGVVSFLMHALVWTPATRRSLAVAVSMYSCAAASAVALVRSALEPARIAAALPAEWRAVLFDRTPLETISHVMRAMDSEPFLRLSTELAPLFLAKDKRDCDEALENVSAHLRARLTAKGAVGALLALPPVPDTPPNLDAQAELVRRILTRESRVVAGLARCADALSAARRRVASASNEDLQVWLIISLLFVLVARYAVRVLFSALAFALARFWG